MLTFNTQFPVNESKTIEDLLETVKIWILESPHSKLPKEDILRISYGNDYNIKSPSESIQLLHLKRDNHELLGVKHTTTQESIRWTTEISGSKKEFSFWISIQVSCDNSVPTHKIPNTKKPHIIKLILNNLGGGTDGEIQVSSHAKCLNSKQIELAKEIINGASSNLMPVIYASAGNNDSPAINTEELAYHLSGMAHLIIEPNRDFSFDLRHETGRKNAYGGAVAIYWPEGLGRYLFLPWGKYENPKQIELEAKQVIKTALLSMRPLKDCNWQHITEQKSRIALDALKSSGSSRIEEYIEHFDTEIQSLRDEVLKLERENSRLNSQAFYRSNDQQSDSINIPSEESDLYHGEHQDIVIDALEALLAQTPEKHKRRRDVISGILKKNKKTGKRKALIKEVKEILNQYQKMDDRTKKSLERLGFEIISEDNHYKLVFNCDHRYHIPIAKTPSDFRSGKNTASDLCGTLFGNGSD